MLDVFHLDPLTQICLGVILLTIVYSLCYLFYIRNKDKLITSHRSVEYLPTLVSTLGVLGTFVGITKGLLAFNTADLDHSLPGLLDGLKTAFFTSILGMFGSGILSGLLNRFQDKKDSGVSDIHQAAGIICQAVQDMSTLNKQTIEKLADQMEQQRQVQQAFYRSMGDAMKKVESTQTTIAGTLSAVSSLMSSLQTGVADAMDSLIILQRSQESAIGSMKETSAAMLSSIGNVEETIAAVHTSTATIAENTHHTDEILDTLSGMATAQEETNAHLGKLKSILDAEVDQIERSMDKTNELLERKFNEFTELLKKSNTEALVEVMKKVTEEFQKHMNMLISKLIQENFEQLNKSVERLNQWQQENKEMISSLTRQYKEMADNFEGTSTSLDHVKNDTEALVAEGGKLQQIVNALNQVIVQDEKFIQTSEHLQKTAELSKSNMEAFDESTKKLNEWVKTQRNFRDSVTLLIEKLEEINKIRDYGETFWQGTRQSLNEGVGILNHTATTLSNNLTNIDRQFYQRLNATLANLDACIQAMINHANRR